MRAVPENVYTLPVSIYIVSRQKIKESYADSDDPPQVVIVGSSFPLDAMPPMTEQAQKDVEASAQQDLGTSYHVAYAMSEKTI